MKRLCFGMVVALSLLVVRTASATTQNYLLHGSSCFSIVSGLSASVSQYGVNASSTALTVMCPLLLPSLNYTSYGLEVVGYNRSSTDHLSCTINATDTNGNNFLAGTASLNANLAAVQVATASINTPVSPMGFVICHLPASTPSGFSHLTDVFVTVGF